jgi:TonB family protein
MALELHQEGTVVLLMSANEAGMIISIEVEKSSGFSVLDRHALEWVRRHWILPPGAGTRAFEAPMTYTLEKPK